MVKKSIRQILLSLILIPTTVAHAGDVSATLDVVVSPVPISITTLTIDPNPAGPNFARGDTLEKTIDYFTDATRSNPSIMVGHSNYPSGSGGMFLYTNDGSISGTWTAHQIAIGLCYERSRSVTFPGDSFPSLVASCDDQIILLNNPANTGGDPTGTWSKTILNSAAGAHDIRLADIDGDGKIDIICSASDVLGDSPNFILYQNSRTSWQLVSGPGSLQDAIGVMPIGGGPRNNIVGPAADGSGIYWFSYPGSRTGTWTPHFLGDLNKGGSVGVGTMDGKDYVIAASNELYPNAWATGLAYYTQGVDPTQPWTQHQIDPTWRAVHEINTGSFASGKLAGTPYFIVAEEEQACTTGQPDNHPRIPCRVTLFYRSGSEFTPLQIFDKGTQNQDVISFQSGILVAGANHGVFGGFPSLLAWRIVPQ
jgi:hypothetical protein